MQKQPSKHQQQRPCCQQIQEKNYSTKHYEPKKHHKLIKHHGIAHIQSTFSNTFITITNRKGDKRTGSSSGCLSEFRGSRRSRSNKYAAQATAERVAQAATQLEIKSVEVRIKGINLVRKGLLLKGLKEGGLIITRIRDVTPVPHNGCRPPKRRRV
nr:ribosomal protein S subunit 11 [Haplopteris ensiformis]